MDEFEDAFNSVGSGQEPSNVTPVKDDVPAPAPAPDKQVQTEKNEPEALESEQPESSKAPAPAPASEDEDPAKLRQKLSTLQGMLAKQGDELKQLREAQKAPAAPPPQPPAPAPAPADDEDADVLADLEESAPTLSKAIKAAMKRQRVEMEKELAEKYGKTIEEVRGEIAPLKSSADELARERHMAAIHEKHADANQLVQSQEFSDWLESRSSIARDAYKGVLQKGTASQVIELFDDFKRDTKKAPDGAVDATGNDPAAARREQQKKSMAAVPSRAAPANPNGSSRNDFDAGFEARAAETQ